MKFFNDDISDPLRLQKQHTLDDTWNDISISVVTKYVIHFWQEKDLAENNNEFVVYEKLLNVCTR